MSDLSTASNSEETDGSNPMKHGKENTATVKTTSATSPSARLLLLEAHIFLNTPEVKSNNVHLTLEAEIPSDCGVTPPPIRHNPQLRPPKPAEAFPVNLEQNVVNLPH